MTEATSAGNGQQVQVRVVAQYIKDLSFESPNIHKLLEDSGEAPNLRVEVNVNAGKVSGNAYESVIHFKAEATSKIGTIYDMELSYAGMFQVDNIPDGALEPFLMIECPTLMFPFVRRLIADLTREGGFPPLLLDPINFASLYTRRQQELQAQAKPAN
ncbi:MAG TPA: protein-export chaperone SecB [Hyphomicrobiaceae bacterium]|jgi:preprotein translocase subunit SecB|nr:protein-export chaperone SecB [Hyphomicrobiaceae bacterium]